MIPPDVRAKIREIEIKTKRLLRGMSLGDTLTRRTGAGFEFNQIRDYASGDDVRFIDWKSSARSQDLKTREYLEDRNRTIWICVDVSASSYSTLLHESRFFKMAYCASVLAFVGDHARDAVGLVLFSNEIECVIPPARGRTHNMQIIEKLYNFSPQGTTTSLAAVFDFLAQHAGRDAIACILSDCIDHNFEKSLARVFKRYEIVMLRMLTDLEKAGADLGYLSFIDSESGSLLEVNMKSGTDLDTLLLQRTSIQEKLFKKYRVSLLDIDSRSDALHQMAQFFARTLAY